MTLRGDSRAKGWTPLSYLLAAKLADRIAQATTEAAEGVFRRTPKALRHTLTLDTGNVNPPSPSALYLFSFCQRIQARY